MNSKLPIFLIIPHGGTSVPEELSGYEHIDDFGLFIESDTCANDLFNFKDSAVTKINTKISRLFVDTDRSLMKTPPKYEDGIIKKESINGRKIFEKNIFPDELAISNIMKRYYTPFHDYIQKVIDSGKIKLILECHTMMPVGARNSKDPGRPRPLINIENIINKESRPEKTCPTDLAENFLRCFKKYFNNEDLTVSQKFSLNKPNFNGHILEKYGNGKIPMIRFSISTSLLLNDSYFSYEYLTVDKLRINEINKKICSGITKFASKFL